VRDEETDTLHYRWRVSLATGAGRSIPRPSVSLSADRRYVSVAPGGSKATIILDAASGKTIREINGTAPVFVPGQNTVLTRPPANNPGAPLQVWPLPDGAATELRVANEWLGGNRANVLAFSRDGRLLAIAETAGTSAGAESGQRTWEVKVWDWPSLSLRTTLRHTAPVTALRFRNDSTALLTLTPSEAAIHAWDLASETEFARVPLASESPGARSMTFTWNGGIAFTDSAGVTVLPLRPAEWVEEACARLTRNLSRGEWDLAVGANVSYTRTCPELPDTSAPVPNPSRP
jgi:WD40 repeat protein